MDLLSRVAFSPDSGLDTATEVSREAPAADVLEVDAAEAGDLELETVLDPGLEPTFELEPIRLETTFSVWLTKIMSDSSRYPEHSSLRPVHRRHDGRASSHFKRGRECSLTTLFAA